MKKPMYFVPVDFSECSYNALQYATMLARFAKGQVRLCHVISFDELPESDNPVSVSLALDRLEHRARQKMKSLKEIISMEGISAEDEIVIGNVRLELMKQIENLRPDVIVIGKQDDCSSRADIVTYITRSTRIPVVVVPGSHNPRVPNRAVLATDMKAGVAEFAPVFEILKNTSNQVSVLNLSGRQIMNAQHNKWVEKINATYGMQISVLNRGNSNGHISEFIRTNKVDLVCIVNRTRGILQRLLWKRNSGMLPDKIEVPVLVVNR